MRSRGQPLLEGGVAHGLLNLVEAAHLDLAHPFAGDAVRPAQAFQRGAFFLEAALGEDIALAGVQDFQRPRQKPAPPCLPRAHSELSDSVLGIPIWWWI